jgi:hypothetical protein
MNSFYKKYFYKSCLVIFLLLSGLTYAQEIPPIVDFRQSDGFGALFNEKGEPLRDRVQINRVLIATQVQDPFEQNRIIWHQIPFDVIFKACSSEENEYLQLISYRLSDTFDFYPLFEEEPYCHGSLSDFNHTQTFGMDEGSNWLRVQDIRRYSEVIVEDVFGSHPSIVTTRLNMAFEFNLGALIFEKRWEEDMAHEIPPPIVFPDQITILLDWGEQTQDLDVHLTGPDPGAPGSYNNEPERFHIYFANKENNVATLDTGEFSNTKPEKVNIFPPPDQAFLREGIYRFTVHYFNGNGTIADSGVTVHLRIGNQPEQVFIPHQTEIDHYSSMDIWVVFELHVANDGMVTVVPIQYYDSGIPPSEVH